MTRAELDRQLKETLERAFVFPEQDSRLLTKMKLKLATVASPLAEAPDFIKTCHQQPCARSQCRRRLILLFQDTAPSKTIPVCGLYAYEYMSFNSADEPLQRTLYISKVDSTGLLQPRHVQRKLIETILEAYVSWLLSLDTVPVHIHVLSLSNPEYLFPASSQLAHKHMLPGKRLIYWWKQLLDAVTSKWNSDVVVERYWLIPGMEHSLLPKEQREDSKWHWGVPYDDDASALDVVPRFHDDAMSSCLQRSVHDDSVSVKTFFGGLLGEAQEFRASDAGLFVLCAGPREHDTKPDAACSEVTETEFAALECLLNIKDGEASVLTFGTLENAETSSAALLDLLPVINMELQVPLDSAKRPAVVQATPVVNVLQVKRRKKV